MAHEFVVSQTDFHDYPSEATISEMECQCGLGREEYLRFKSEEAGNTAELVKSFTPHQRHLFVYSGMKSTEWNPMQEKEGVALLLQQEIKKQVERTTKIKVGLVEWPSVSQREHERLEAVEEDSFDVLLLPDGILYRRLRPDMISDFVTAQFVDNTVFDRIESERTNGVHHVFVCSHRERDARCGLMGPRIYKSMVTKTRDIGLPVQVHRTSHVGGHKYAGNVIIFRYDQASGTYTGDWYGYVNDTTDVDKLIEQHIVGGNIVTELWRGRCALPEGMTAQQFLEQQQPQRD